MIGVESQFTHRHPSLPRPKNYALPPFLNYDVPLHRQREFYDGRRFPHSVIPETALRRLRNHVVEVRTSSEFRQIIQEMRATSFVPLDVLNRILDELNCPWLIESFSSEDTIDLSYARRLDHPFQINGKAAANLLLLIMKTIPKKRNLSRKSGFLIGHYVPNEIDRRAVDEGRKARHLFEDEHIYVVTQDFFQMHLCSENWETILAIQN